MPMVALIFTRWSKAMVRVIERAKGVIPGCKPAGSNRGMIGQILDATPRLYVPKPERKVLLAKLKKQNISSPAK